jgi:hypothetical protein
MMDAGSGGLFQVSTADELHQFLLLWAKVDEVRLSDRHDSIRWWPCSRGNYSAKSAYEFQFYSAKSAYEFQFIGRWLQPHLEKVWHTKVEGKVKLFLRLLLRNRNWTANRLLRRGLYCNPTCLLCDQEPETTAHLTVQCYYAKKVWASHSVFNAPLARSREVRRFEWPTTRLATSGRNEGGQLLKIPRCRQLILTLVLKRKIPRCRGLILALEMSVSF